VSARILGCGISPEREDKISDEGVIRVVNYSMIEVVNFSVDEHSDQAEDSCGHFDRDHADRLGAGNILAADQAVLNTEGDGLL
jgi:hypothetical protein